MISFPVVSGNVSFYNETDEQSIHPTPMVGLVGVVNDTRLALPAVTSEEGVLYKVSSKKHKKQFTSYVKFKHLTLQSHSVKSK